MKIYHMRTHRLWESALILACILAVAACSAPQRTPKPLATPLTVPGPGNIVQEELQGLTTPPLPLRFAPPPPDPLRTTLVTLAGTDIPLREVLHRLNQPAGLNLLLESEVNADQPISLAIEALPLQEALRIILTPLGLFARREGTFLVVYGFETRTWALSPPVVATVWQDTISSRGQTGAGAATSTSAATSTLAAAPSAPQLGSIAELHREGRPPSFWPEIEKALGNMVRPPGWLSVNQATGTVTVRERPDRLREIDRYLAALEGELARQVEVEVKILEVTLTGGETLGIDWRALALGDSTRGLLSLAGRATGALPGVNAAALPFSAVLATTRSEVLIRALSQQGRVRIVSQPRLLLVNHQSAAIQVGQVRSYLASVTSSTTTGVGAQVSATVGAVQDGITLTLTPRIIGTDVVLIVTPVLSRVSQIRQVKFSEGNLVEAPDLTNRALSTTVRVPDGGMVVLGGLLSEERTHDQVGLPWLSRIPIIGWLTGSERAAMSRTELVITLSPTIRSSRQAAQKTP